MRRSRGGLLGVCPNCDARRPKPDSYAEALRAWNGGLVDEVVCPQRVTLTNSKRLLPGVCNCTLNLLIGDTNNNSVVNAADVAQTKSRVGQAVNATNFRSDINANGSINAADTAIIKSNSGTSLPP